MKEIRLHITNNTDDWKDWDQFLAISKRGIYLQLSDWLKSYRAYGFEGHLILSKDPSGQIQGGMGLVLAKAGPLKILVAPYGPVLDEGKEDLFPAFVSEFYAFAKKSGAFLAQLSAPIATTSDFQDHFMTSQPAYPIAPTGKGLLFKYVTGLSAFRAVKLFAGEKDAYEKVRSNYKANTRRDVNKSNRMGNELVFAESVEEIQKAYDLIELNAENQGYAVRSWDDFGPTLISLVNCGHCIIPCCQNEGSLKGALIIFEAGQKLHYIMGATLREKKDLLVGHFLQDQVIQLAISKGYDFYDISMGGSPGVVRFKEGFGGEVLPLPEPQYWVLKPAQFFAYQKLLPWVQKNKTFVSKIVKKFK